MADDISNYPNPLDEFRSYSYHFILTVAPTSEALRLQIEEANGQKLYSRVTSARLGESIDLGQQERAWLVLDTRRFSQFSITGYESEHVYGTGDPNNPSQPFNLSRMSVVDTTGFNFFSFLQDLLENHVQSSRASAFFLLNIIFIGHRATAGAEPETQIISTCYIPLLLQFMSADVTSSGTRVELEFIETEGGIARTNRLWQLNHMGTKVTAITLPGETSVRWLLQALEDQLNWNAAQYYRLYQTAPTSQEFQSATGHYAPGKIVQYMISLPPEWSGNDYQVSAAGGSRRIEQKFIAKGVTKDSPEVKATAEGITFPAEGEAQMSFSEKTTITDAITDILESSPQILQKASEQRRQNGEAIIFKIVTNITSSKNSYLVHFDIYPYRLIQPIRPDLAPNQANVITYNYIFTGLNSHIKDLKITYNPESVAALDFAPQLGSSRLQQLAALGQREIKISTGAERTESTSNPWALRSSDPVFPNALSTDQQKNFVSQRDTEQFSYQSAQQLNSQMQQYRFTMAFAHFLSTISLDMSIRGNPNLLRKYADRNVRNGQAPHGLDFDAAVVARTNFKDTDFYKASQTALKSARQQYYQRYYLPRLQKATAALVASRQTWLNDPLLDSDADVLSYPLFVYVKILNPNVDWDGAQRENAPPFTNKNLFYDDLYRVMFIKHQLIDGQFVQQLNMIPVTNPINVADNARRLAATQARNI